MRLISLLFTLIVYTMAEKIVTKFSPVTSITESAEHFSNKFFKTVAKSRTGRNIFTSPLSVHAVLSMSAYGARENTTKEMRYILKLPDDDGMAIIGFGSLMDSLEKIEGVDFKLANSVFIRKKLIVNPEYKAMATNTFKSKIKQVDFRNSNAIAIINSWSAKETNNIIKNIVKSGNIKDDTSMVLLTAVYFKGQWKSKFDPEKTSDRPFHIDEDTVRLVPTMYQRIKIVYGDVPELKAKFVEIPYKNEELSMFIILPDEMNGVQELEQKFETISLKALRKKGKLQNIELYLPKFRIVSTFQLSEVLKEMGMVEMFSSRANFRGMTKENIKLASVFQKAYIEIDEEGGESAVTTAKNKEQNSGTPITFSANRPFLYFIIKGQNEMTMFQGRAARLTTQKCLDELKQKEQEGYLEKNHKLN